MGVKYLRKGQKAILTIPSHLAYGKKGIPGLIGPDETLYFDVDLVDWWMPQIEVPVKTEIKC